MKAELERELIPWSIVNKGIHENKSYKHVNGEIYSFKQMSERVRQLNTTDNPNKKIKFLRKEFINFFKSTFRTNH